MYPEKIKLDNRYKENVYLKQIKDNKYELISPNPYIRLGIKENDPDSYTFVDPSGGPFITEFGQFNDWKTNDVYIAEKIYIDRTDNKIIIEIS